MRTKDFSLRGVTFSLQLEKVTKRAAAAFIAIKVYAWALPVPSAIKKAEKSRTESLSDIFCWMLKQKAVPT